MRTILLVLSLIFSLGYKNATSLSIEQLAWLKLARKEQKAYGILPSIKIGQLHLESSKKGKLANSIIARKFNNVYGIKWTGKKSLDWPAIGKTKRKEGWFCVYKNKFDSFRHHSLKLGTSRYKLVKKAKNYKQAAKQLQIAYYASDKNYAKKLINIIQKNGYHRFD